MALTIEQKRNWAQLLYTRERMAQKEVAGRIKVTEKTVSRWKQKYNWDELRQSLLITKEEQVRRLYIIVDKLTTRIEESEQQGDSKEADKLVKYTAAINALETETNLAQIIDTAQQFIAFVKQSNFEEAKNITVLFDGFIQQKLQ